MEGDCHTNSEIYNSCDAKLAQTMDRIRRQNKRGYDALTGVGLNM